MDAVLKADIFFFVTTVAVIAIGIAAIIALIFFIQILRDVRYVSRRIREQSDRIFQDVEDLRSFVKQEGRKTIDFKKLVSGVIGTFLSKRKSRRRKAPKKE